MNIFEIEELSKSVKPHAMKAFLRNAAILKNPNATAEQRELAAANIKALSGTPPNPTKIDSKPKKVASEVTQLVQKPVAPTPSPKMEFHEEFAQLHGVDPVKFKAAFQSMTPEQQAMTREWHAQQIATPPKMAKSLDTLYSLFAELKKHI